MNLIEIAKEYDLKPIELSTYINEELDYSDIEIYKIEKIIIESDTNSDSEEYNYISEKDEINMIQEIKDNLEDWNQEEFDKLWKELEEKEFEELNKFDQEFEQLNFEEFEKIWEELEIGKIEIEKIDFPKIPKKKKKQERTPKEDKE